MGQTSMKYNFLRTDVLLPPLPALLPPAALKIGSTMKVPIPSVSGHITEKTGKTAVGAPMQSHLSSPQRKPGSTATASGRKKMENTSFCIQTALSHRWPGGRLMENGTSLTAQDIWFPNATSVQNPPISITGSEQTACGIKTGIRNSRIGHSMRCISFLCRRNFPILQRYILPAIPLKGLLQHGKALKSRPVVISLHRYPNTRTAQGESLTAAACRPSV